MSKLPKVFEPARGLVEHQFHIGVFMLCVALAAVARGAQQDLPLDDGWRFTRGDPAKAQTTAFNDGAWQPVDLPHDWSIGGPISSANPAGTAGGFLPMGVGWYRKTLDVPPGWARRAVSLQFDGVYMASDVFLNGEKLGGHVYGFTPSAYDLTGRLKIGQPNVIAVRVDNSIQQNCRWYSGSGIYRHVSLAVRDPVHVARFGVVVRTDAIADGAAHLSIATTVLNTGEATNETRVQCVTAIFAADASGHRTGELIATADEANGPLPGRNDLNGETYPSHATLPHARLWNLTTPNLYVALTTVSVNGNIVDTRETTFGVREIKASAADGLLLNGQPIKLYGACVHDDNGPLGVAAFDRAEVRRAEELKAAGFNAVRCAHNPPAPAFLDACDRLGLLVIDEAFDTWSQPKTSGDFARYFNELWQGELDTMILRDRNHPSIIIWSLGNEVVLWGDQTAQAAANGTALIRRARELDPTRFTTTAVAGWNLPDAPWQQMDPLLNQFDLVGYNYAIHRYESDHARFPNRVIIGTESFPRELFNTFDHCDRDAHVIGDFVWTGIDYGGESGIGRYYMPNDPIYFHLDPRQFPYHAANCGDIDFTGFRKPISHARNITWGRGETLYTSVMDMTPDGRVMTTGDWGVTPSRASWTWPGMEGKPVHVQVYSRADAVRLYLNGRLVGEKPTTRAQQFNALFDLPYEPGTLATVALRDGKEIARNVLRTAGPIAGLHVTSDRPALAADGQDLAFVDVETVDASGNFQPTGSCYVFFTIEGPATIAAVGSGNYGTLESFRSNHRQLFNGRVQVVIRSSRTPGDVKLHAWAYGLQSAEINLQLLKP